MLTRRTFIRDSALVSLAIATRARSATPRSRPNLVIITADDLHGDAMGWSGGPAGNTPNLDALARESFGFVNLNCSAPICQPSRQALMTGLVPHRNGGVGFNPINTDVTTLPEVLAAAGYFTAGLNKLKHMMPAEKFPWDWKLDRAPTPDGVQTLAAPADSNRNPANYYRDVSAAIAAATAAKKPFFLNANIVDPHRPFYRTQLDIDMGGVEAADLVAEPNVPGFLDDLPDVRKELRLYHRSVRRCDTSFGEVWRALSDARVLDDTIVVFVADHGMPFPFSKASLYRGGTHTPCLVRWQGFTAGGRDRTHYPSNVDLMPTVLELLGVAPPPNLDGRSLMPLLRKPDPTREEVFTHITSLSNGLVVPGRCVRNARFSYLWNPWSDGTMKYRSESMNGLTFPAMDAAAKSNAVVQSRVNTLVYRSPEEFFDLTADPGERKTLATDPAFRAQRSASRAKLRAHMVATHDPLLLQFDVFLGKTE